MVFQAAALQSNGETQSLRLTRFPLVFAFSYLLFTFALFLLWPINWTIYNSDTWIVVTLYVMLTFAAVYFFGNVAIRSRPRQGRRLSPALIILCGGTLSLVLLTPLSLALTGRGPWEVVTAFNQQRLVYEELQTMIETSTGTSLIVWLGALAAPLTFAAPILGLLYWDRLGLLLRAAALSGIVCTLIMSILRGTDREFGNVLIVVVGVLMLRAARGNPNGSVIMGFLRRNKAYVAVGIVFFILAAALSTDRKSERLGSTARACAIGTGICADLDSPLTSWMGAKVNFGLSMLVVQLTQGYFGMAIATEKPFESTYGLGHSPALLNVASRYLGPSFSSRSYIAKISFENGWSDRYFWSTAMTWWANDFSFPGAVIIFGLFGYILGATWRDSVVAHNDCASVLFICTFLIIIYAPLNNQFFMVIDSYFTFVAWLIAWLLPARRYMRS